MTNTKKTLAEARAIYLAMKAGAITYEQAKEKTKPYLEVINKETKEIAKKFGRSPQKFTFYDLGRGNF